MLALVCAGQQVGSESVEGPQSETYIPGHPWTRHCHAGAVHTRGAEPAGRQEPVLLLAMGVPSHQPRQGVQQGPSNT